MGKLFSIDDEIKSIIQDGLDDLITELGKNCRLVYPSTKWESCDNCIYDPIGQKSSNRWRSGGPISFPNGTACPQCNGQGRRSVVVTEDITLLCELNPLKFVVPIRGVDIRVPNAFLQTKGFLTEANKIKKCDHLLLDIDNETLGNRRYKLKSDPCDISNIIQGRYFVCTWERSG